MHVNWLKVKHHVMFQVHFTHAIWLQAQSHCQKMHTMMCSMVLKLFDSTQWLETYERVKIHVFAMCVGSRSLQ